MGLKAVLQLKPLLAAFYLKAASSAVMHQELENELQKPYPRDHFSGCIFAH